ncbi:serine/threonine-protein phosphatase 6 regulatory ankyrin repeat subunit A-like [Haliotis cracherodii]|uniref:serine/threonine-protein phosphatase 6 regulatory ankyrin repeat subunit A-like n=1 Tax=Haliotis cracherodii TaxID=6455 RepID=UPI0039EC05F0
MENAQLAEARMSLWMRSTSPSLSVSLSDIDGHYSGIQESVSEDTSSAEGKHWQEERGQPPHLISKWEVEEGNMKLIYVDRNNMLSKACREGKLDIVKNIIATGSVDINTRSEGGWTPVLTAAVRGYRNIFDVLVKEGCDLSAVLDNGNNILHVACFGGNTDIIQYLVSRRVVSLESKGMYGRTAVMKAASVGNKGVFDLLVSKGCNLSVVDDVGNNILHVACISDNVQIVDYLISHDIANIESRGQYGRTAVMVAATKGQKKAFDLLVSKGCNLSVVDNEGNNILHVACLSDNVQIVVYLISHHIADIESRGQYGRTAVMKAATKGRKKVFDLLVSKGCNLSVVDDVGNNILHAACISDNVQIVDYLISHDIANIESRGQYGRTAVMVAATKGQKKAFDLLVSKGCNLSVVDDVGNNILHVACISDNVQIVDYLISHDIANIEIRGQYGRTAVMAAAANGHQKVLDLLVSKGCNLSVVDDVGNNILHVACISDNVQIVDYLISHDIANIESRGQYGRTAVMVAAALGKKAFDLLVSKGCNLSVVDDNGDNILHAACLSDNVQIVDYLISHDIADIESRGQYGRTAVMVAAANGHQKVLDLLVSKGCILSVVDDDGDNILHVACLSDNVQIVDYLISHDIADIESRGQYGRTAVMVAAAEGKKKAFDLLVSKGCNLSVVDDDGDNILHSACLSDNVQIVDYLISHDIADIESRGQYGRTAVMKAAAKGHQKVFDLLVSKGCNLSVVDNDGNNILHLSCSWGRVDIVRQLLVESSVDVSSTNIHGQTPVQVARRFQQDDVVRLLSSWGYT